MFDADYNAWLDDLYAKQEAETPETPDPCEVIEVAGVSRLSRLID